MPAEFATGPIRIILESAIELRGDSRPRLSGRARLGSVLPGPSTMFYQTAGRALLGWADEASAPT